MNNVKKLHKITGASLSLCKTALDKCENDLEVSIEYIRLITDCVSHVKIVNDKKTFWNDDDYVKYAKFYVRRK
jgi:translation elongation factor EF-Ts